ncbi:unnamed protein product [Clonostachys chloroleuca]|uniref:Uncharacterized protein n=1 Tax=Clonostachys chloroleuca TaxID=1926264 RepID=A0AA35M665_9HYPO|nr:unnamed protein product [Clonostachys chloroleuca]
MTTLDVVNARVAIDSSPARNGRHTERDIRAHGEERNASRPTMTVGNLEKHSRADDGGDDPCHPLRGGPSKPIVEKA